MRLYEQITSETFVLGVIGGAIGTLLISILFLIAGKFFQLTTRTVRYIRSSRAQKRRENFVEVWRRLKNDKYLVYQEHESHFTLFMTTVAFFTMIILEVLLTLSWEKHTEAELVLYASLLVILVVLIFFLLAQASLVTSLNLAARAYGAGLVRKKGTRQFNWPRRP